MYKPFLHKSVRSLATSKQARWAALGWLLATASAAAQPPAQHSSPVGNYQSLPAAAQPNYSQTPPYGREPVGPPPCLSCDSQSLSPGYATGPRGGGRRGSRCRAWWFRQYAGSVEMQTKTLYPKDYYGSYYYYGWRPSWIRDMPVPPSPLATDPFYHQLDFFGPQLPMGHPPLEYPTLPGEEHSPREGQPTLAVPRLTP